MNIYSSGGVGDALIVAMKIEHMRLWTKTKINYWGHYEKHECHREPCTSIIKHFVSNGDCWIDTQPEKRAKELAESNGTYIDTKIINFPHPYLPHPIENNFKFKTKIWDHDKYICIQTTAGRLNDNTRRSISFKVIHGLKKRFPDRDIVLLGPERLDITENHMINLTGETQSILDAFSIINDCVLFIGQDGIMAYYAAMLGKPTIISYHLPNLLNHYWNNYWSLHAVAMVGGNNVVSLPAGCESIFKMVK